MTILFIDDEEHVLQSIKRSLYKWFKEFNYNAHFSSSSKDALEYVKENAQDIAVIVSDQKMPDLSGSKLLQIIGNKHPNIMFIILSGQSDVNDFEEFINLGIISFINKPWDATKLKQEILKAVNLYKLKSENYQLKKRLDNELELAKEFQSKLLKLDNIEKLPFEFNVTYKPSPISGISGDYYDLVVLGNKKYLVISGDVSGHGIKPAFITIALKNLIQHKFSNVSKGITPLEFVKWLNIRVYELLNKFKNIFISFSLLLLNFNENSMELINAGQPPVLLIRAGQLKQLTGSNMVLGVDNNLDFSSNKYEIKKGDEIILLSDGIHPSGIKGSLKSDYIEQIKHINFRNHDELLNFVKNNFDEKDLDDDKTIITIKV